LLLLLHACAPAHLHAARRWWVRTAQ
jgi:hypothetical protein